MSRLRVIYIDDDIELSEFVEEYMVSKGLQIKLVHNHNNLIPLLNENTFDICLMDVKMPGKDGFTLAEEILSNGITIPFLFLTGQTRKEDKIRGLKLGAQDYIIKPFSLEELYLRITNICKRSSDGETLAQLSEYMLGNIRFNINFNELNLNNKVIPLSGTEAKLLKLLCQNSNKIVSRDEILMKIWGTTDHYKSLSLNVYITKLRKHLASQNGVSLVNEHGEGYKLVNGRR